VQGVDQIVPVDVYAPGCPPGPETLIHAIVTLHAQIQSGELLQRREATGAGAGLQLAPPADPRPRGGQFDAAVKLLTPAGSKEKSG
jgi:NADH-quinone oxidoreductase subunit B